MHSMSDEPETDTDAYRPSEATRLRTIITGHREGLTICGISGAGGIGKSYLVEHVLSSVETAKAGWMALRIDAAQAQARGDFFALVDGQLARRSLAPPADPRVDYFPETRRVAAAHRALVARVTNELERRRAPEDVRRAAVAILKAAHFLNEAIPKTRDFVDVAKYNLEPDAVHDRIDEAWDTINTLKTLRDLDFEWLPAPVRDRLGMNLASRVKRDLYGAAADAFVSDLNAALSGESSKNSLNGARLPIPGLDRLLLVVDDYEALGATLSDFLISSLVPRLAEARFATVLIIAGRDDLEATHPGWSQHCKRYLTDPDTAPAVRRRDGRATHGGGGNTRGSASGHVRAHAGLPAPALAGHRRGRDRRDVSPVPETILRPDDALDEPRRARVVYPHVLPRRGE